MKFINLTPHTINIISKDFKMSIDPDKSYPVPRVNMQRHELCTIMSIPIYKNTVGDVMNLPDQVDDTYYIVSTLVKMAAPARKDLLSPGNLIRDDRGNVIGCDGFDANL